MKNNIKLILTYDGTSYKGFQRLGNTKNTIQEKVETCLSRLLDEEIKIIGSSRTDAGVHAFEQIVNFHTNKIIDTNQLKKDLNKYLPRDIGIIDASIVPSRFHSRFWSEKKTYLYRINMDETPNIFERNYVYNLCENLDIELIEKGITKLIGEHDFQGFTKRKSKKSTVRIIYNIDVVINNNELQLYVTGNGFLYNMIRIIVGTLIEIGKRERSIETINQILKNKKRADAGYLAPANGLILYKNYLIEK